MSIGKSAFYNCRRLTTIVIPRGALDEGLDTTGQWSQPPLISLGFLALDGWDGTFKEDD